MSDTFSLRNKIAVGICDIYFNGSRSLKGKIITDMKPLKLDYLLKLQQVLEDQQDYIFKVVSKKQKVNGFNTPYGKFKYLYQIAGRLIKDAECKETEPKQEPPAPSPQPKAATRPSWLDELEADSQPPKQASIEDAPVITESDLFESEPDTMHEAWAKLSEDEQRRNWATAIAGHQQQRKPEYAPDEMY